MITLASIKSEAALKEYTVRQLGELAQKAGVSNWRSLRKDQLIRSLVRAAKARSAGKPSAKSDSSADRKASRATASKESSRAKASRSRSSRAAKSTAKPARKMTPHAVRRIQELNSARERQKDLSQTHLLAGAETRASEPPRAARRTEPRSRSESRQTDNKQTKSRAVEKDRIALLVRDAYWLQACWDLTRQSVDRARAAMAEYWHTARPVLRVFSIEGGTTTSASERVVRDIEIHGGVKNWYIDVPNPPKSFRVEIGYLASNGRFHSLARSNTVTTPVPGATEGLDGHWKDVAEDYERIYALSGGYTDEHASGDLQEMFEERLQRPMGSPAGARFGVGAERLLNRNREFLFEIDAEMIVLGRTKPSAHVTLGGEPVKLREDGTFAVRLAMPDRRQVLPIVASSSDGVEQRTIVLAVERNTKIMEPVIHESND